MADFEVANKLTRKNEGNYSNNKNDKGKETYGGRSRRYFPDWEGWKIIDSMKSRIDFPKCLDTNKELQKLVDQSYKEIEWEAIKGDLIPNQVIANEILDQATQFGTTTAIKYLQRTLNLLNRNQRADFYPDIKVDGVITANGETLKTLTISLKKNGVEFLFNVLNGFQIKHFIDWQEANRTAEEFYGVFKRVDIIWN